MSTRRHETTIDGVTAWAGPWKRHFHIPGRSKMGASVHVGPQTVDRIDASLQDDPRAGDVVRFSTRRIETMSEARRRVTEIVLAEAAQIAQGGEVPE